MEPGGEDNSLLGTRLGSSAIDGDPHASESHRSIDPGNLADPDGIRFGRRCAGESSPRPVIGRWDVTVQGPDGKYPSWFEVRLSGRNTLVGSYVGRTGTPARFPRSSPPMARSGSSCRRSGNIGVRTSSTKGGSRAMSSAARPPTTQARASVGRPVVRLPLDRGQSYPWGEPIELFNGGAILPAKPRNPDAKHGWRVRTACW